VTLRIFSALLARDAHVARREAPFLLVRTVLQPLLFAVIFGWLLPRLGLVAGGYAAALLPGIVAVSIAVSSLQAVALPMVTEFGFTREIEDRLLAPVPTWTVALEKVLAGTLQGVATGLVVLPLALAAIARVEGLTLLHGAAFLGIALLGALAFAALGLLLGTAIPPQQVALVFSVVLAPMLFFGCAYYPWAGLRAVRPLQIAVLVNPLVYLSEGLRGALTPSLPHMNLAIVAAVLALVAAGLWIAGARTFERKAIS
jgi:ABC-2 type transport system permease protein